MHEMPDVVVLRTGSVRGIRDERVRRFLGIPFALAPTGVLRGVEPQPVAAWQGERDATSFAPSPAQSGRMLRGDAVAPSEDCLFLNVWAPAQAEGAPVLVWVYGGGFEGGTASTAMFSGDRFAREHGLVVVTVNYRVGFLGFGYAPGLIASNLGVRDVIAALGWVRDNISALGGDPGRVTVMGESAGGFIAAALAAAPSAQGLLHRVIAFSGAASRLVRRQRTEALTRAWLTAVGIADAAALAEAPIEQLLEVQGAVIPQEIGARNAADVNALGVTLDADLPNAVVMAHPMEALTVGEGAHLDLLVGCTNAELSSFRAFMGEAFAPASRASLLSELAGNGVPDDRQEPLLTRYAEGAGDLAETRERVLTDWIYRLPGARLLRARAGAVGRTYAVEFRGDGGGPLGHGADIPLYFPTDEAAAVRGEAIRASISEFAATGRTSWPEYGGDGYVRVVGGADECGLFDPMLEAWEGVVRP